MPFEVRLQSDYFGFGQLRHSFANFFIDRICKGIFVYNFCLISISDTGSV